jgi:WhiB family redox-sensing transcriptional regulator
MDQASCLGLEPDMFFPGPWEDPSPAKAVCAGCPVRQECLSAALARREPDGIWGGLTATERRVDARRRRRRRRTARADAVAS